MTAQVITTTDGHKVAPLSPMAAHIMRDIAKHGPCASNIKTAREWQAIRHQCASTSSRAVTIATAWARMQLRMGYSGFAYVLNGDDSVTRVIIDHQGKARVSSAMPKTLA